MGNAPSSVEATEPPRETSRRLSKPRIGRHGSITAGLLSSKRCSDNSITRQTSRRRSGGALPTRPSISAHASLSSPPVNGLVSPNCESVPSDFIARRPSDSDPLSQNTDISVARDLEPYPPQPRSHRRQSVNMHKHESFVPESKYAIGSAFETSHPSSKSTTPQISRANSDVSLYAPIRRRSLIQTPGVATRAPSVSEPTRRSSTKLKPRTRHARTTSFDPGPEIISVLPRISDCGEERAGTPNDVDYKQLGAMTFGSLRITNGAPSPCCDGKGGTDGSEQKPSQSKDDSDSRVDAKPKERTPGPKIVQPRPISVGVSPVTATFLKLDSGDSSQPSVAPTHHEKNLKARHSGFSFGSFSRVGSESRPTKLKTTSKHTSAEDTLLGEGLSLSPLEYEGVAPCDMASTRRRASRRGSDATSKTRFIARPDSGFISSPISEASSKPFSKTDSGYSSNVSLRSLRNSKTSMDKELLSSPDEPSMPPVPNRSRPASFAGDSRLPSSRPPFLEKESAPALLDYEARVPSPPKDVGPVSPVTSSTVKKSASVPLLNRSATSAKTKGTARRFSLFSMSGNKVSALESQNSIEGHVTDHQAGIQKPGPLKRLFSVASRREPRGNPGQSFRNKAPRDTGRGAGAGFSGVETANAEEPSGTAPPQTALSDIESPEEPVVRRHRSLQSIPAAIVNAAVSVLPSRKHRREPVSSAAEESDSDEDEGGETEGNERRSKTSSTESDTAYTEDFTRDSLLRNGFDPSFMAMTSARDAYFSPTPSRPSSKASCNTGRVGSWSVDVRTAEAQALSRAGSLASLRPRSSQTTSIREHPPMSASNSMKRARSVVQLRVPAPLRPQPTPSRLRRSQSQAHCLRPSCELIYSYPPITASNRPSLDNNGSRLEIQNRYQQRSNDVRGGEDPISFDDSEKFSFLPRGPGSFHSRTDSFSSRASSTGLCAQSMGVPPYSGPQKHIPRRPSSASQFPDMKRRDPVLRHHASYEVPPFRLISRSSREFRRQSPDPWTSTHYDQLQMQYGGTAFDPKAGGYPPYVPRAAHSRNRSSVPQGPGAPYRVLHSYYSPAYRHVPIWG